MYLKNFPGLAALFCLCLSTNAQVDNATKYSVYIDKVDLQKHLEVLASDQYEGRETGKKGQQMTAAYLKKEFAASGCSFAPGMTQFEQTFDVIEVTPGGKLQFDGVPLAFKTDFIYFGAKTKQDLSALPVYTKEVASLKKDESEYILMHKLEGLDIRDLVTNLKKDAPKGLRAVVLLTSEYQTVYEYLEHYTTTKNMRLAEQPTGIEVPTIIIRTDAVKDAIPKAFSFLFSAKKSKKLRKIKKVGMFSGTLNEKEEKLTSSNVLAFIPGSDPVLSQEVLVITAHYDHIGIDNGVVYNGADDDGTGTVALLELAQAFMMAKKEGNGPKRSILIMPVSGEEKGLLGSSYYTSHPIIPLENTIADLNIDMIGRDDIAHPNVSNYIYIIGSNMLSDDLHNANEKANREHTNLLLDYKFNSLTDPNKFYYRSDHYNFAKNNIPSVFYFSGVHDDYHQPTDDVEKINFNKVETVARLVYFTAWNLANAEKRPVVNH